MTEADQWWPGASGRGGVEYGEGWEKGITKRPEDSFGGDRYVHYLNCDEDFIGVYTCQNASNCTLCTAYCMSIISQQSSFKRILIKEVYSLQLTCTLSPSPKLLTYRHLAAIPNCSLNLCMSKRMNKLVQLPTCYMS